MAPSSTSKALRHERLALESNALEATRREPCETRRNAAWRFCPVKHGAVWEDFIWGGS